MLDALTEPFEQAIGQRAGAELVVLGLVCGPLGVWISLYRRSYAAESIAHAALPGLVAAALIGLPLALGAAAGLLAAALAIALAGRVRNLGGDAAVAVVVTGLIGLGALLALSPDVPPRLAALLFGDPLAVSAGDLALSGALAAGVGLTLAVAHRRLALAGFDPGAAPSLGAQPGRAGTLLLIVIALTTLVAVEALGNLLVVALLIAPGATALRLCARLGPALALAAALAVAEGLAGLYVSHHLELAAGGSIALVAVAVFALALPLGARAGVAGREGGAPGAVGAA